VSVQNGSPFEAETADAPEPRPPALLPEARRADREPAPTATTTVSTLPAAPSPGKRGSRLYALDLLRFIAALTVVMYHYTARGRGWHTSEHALFPNLYPVTVYGWMGVELFFLISGFVICMSSWGRRVGSYFVSRVTRLFPAYLVAVLLTASVLAIWPVMGLAYSKDTVLTNLTMLATPLGVQQVDTVYWTLGIELHFYLLFALVVWRGLTYQRAVGFCVVWTTASIFVPTFAPAFADQILVAQYSPYFIAGIAFYMMHKYGPNLLLGCIVVVSYVLASHQILTDVDQQRTAAGNHQSLTIVYGVLAVFFVLMGLIATGRLSWIRGEWTLALGAVTYPLYLIHQDIGYAVLNRLDSHVDAHILLVTLILAMIATAWLIQRFVEKPLAPKLRRGLRDSLRTPVELQ
jgi:peptidoglycan/LPS O-acetylase OafA/YrhL